MRIRARFGAAALMAVPLATVGAPTHANAMDSPSSVVEDFSYPGADQIFQEHGVRVIKGDGHIRLADCDSGGDLIQTWSLDGWVEKRYCFEIRGKRGFLTVDIPHVYLIQGASQPIVATATYEGQTETVTVPPNKAEPIGGGNATHTLVEMRLSGGGAAEPSPPGPHPFVAKIDTVGRGCSGVLVAANWLATAKTCFAADGVVLAGPPPERTTAIVGRADLQRTGGHETDIVQLVPRADRDLVLAKLATPATGIAPIGLARRIPVAGERMYVAGYGRTADDWTNDRVHAGAFTVAATAPTSMELRRAAGTATSTCKGDVGGPAFREANGQFELFAVHSTSWQTGCFGVTEQRDAANETRTDDIAGWIAEETGPRPFTWQNAHTSRCLADSFGGGLQVLPCATPTTQIWRDISLTAALHQFRNEHTGRCLADSFGGGLQVLPCATPTTQIWRDISPAAAPHQFRNEHTGRCLADSFGGGLQVLPCATPPNQIWQKPQPR